MPAKRENRRHQRKTPDNLNGKVVDTEFSVFEVLLGRVGAAPNQVVAVEVLQPETETSEAELRIVRIGILS